MNESTARNIRVQDRYDELMRIGRHGHYETMFQVVREEIESLRQQLANSIVIDMTKAPESSVKLVKLLRANAESLLCQQAADEIEGLHTELRQQVTLLREPLLYIDEVAKTSKSIISVAAAAMKMLKKIRAALAATKEQ